MFKKVYELENQEIKKRLNQKGMLKRFILLNVFPYT